MEKTESRATGQQSSTRERTREREKKKQRKHFLFEEQHEILLQR